MILVFLPWTTASAIGAEASGRPNVLFLFSDDPAAAEPLARLETILEKSQHHAGDSKPILQP